MKVDCLVVGAGFAGAVTAERLASSGKRVLVVERRPHIGGNAYDEYDINRVQIHRYGPHIFHTNSREVVDYLSRFTEWTPYQHRVLGWVEGQLIPIPFNLTSLHTLFPSALAQRIEDKLVATYGFGKRVTVLTLREQTDPDLRLLGDYVYDQVFLHYTTKQWGLRPEELSTAVTGRVPVVISRDDRYFADRYQLMPRHGYTALFQRLLNHPNIMVMLGADYRQVAKDVTWERMFYTGPIDELLDYRHGPLPYRGIRFEMRHHQHERTQAATVVNYPGGERFTRITDMAMLTGQTSNGTVTITEYPTACEPGDPDKYYPIPQDANRALYARYQADLAATPAITCLGRLADYQYYNMDQIVARALALTAP